MYLEKVVKKCENAEIYMNTVHIVIKFLISAILKIECGTKV